MYKVIIMSALFILIAGASHAQEAPPTAFPLPFENGTYAEGPFRAVISCSNSPVTATLQRDQKYVITLTTKNDGKKNTVTLFRPDQDTLETCFYSLSCRYISKNLKIVARQDPACGRMANDPIYHVIDTKSLKYEKLTSQAAENLELNLELINFQDPKIEKLLKVEPTDQLYPNINIGLALNQDPNGIPGDPIAVSLPRQENTFFSGKEHVLLVNFGGEPTLVKGAFKGKGFDGIWTGLLGGGSVTFTTKKTGQGEDATTGTGQFKFGKMYKISWFETAF